VSFNYLKSTETEIDFCVSLLFELTSLVPLSPPLANSIARCGIAYSAVSLLFFVLSDAQVSNILTKLEAFLSDFFDNIGSLKAADICHQVILGYMKLFDDWNSNLSEEEISLMMKVWLYANLQCYPFYQV
jgi:hypothetical protein